MIHETSRRRFLASSVAASWAMRQAGALLGQSSPEKRGTLDIHLHLFGVGDAGSGCRCGTGWPTDPFDMLADFLAMIRKYKNLWGDTSVLGTAGRVRDMLRLLADGKAKERLLHGSDFPFPATPLAFAGRLGVLRASRLQAIDNLIERDFALKDALGIGRASAERAYRLICDEESQS